MNAYTVLILFGLMVAMATGSGYDKDTHSKSKKVDYHANRAAAPSNHYHRQPQRPVYNNQRSYDDRRGYGYNNGFRRTSHGIASVYNNADRQRQVNYLAERVGAGSGTAFTYGVAGTGRYQQYPGYQGYRNEVPYRDHPQQY